MRKNSGFSLIEVLVALFIFSVGFTGLAGLHLKSIEYLAQNNHRNHALMLASSAQELNTLRSRNILVYRAMSENWRKYLAVRLPVANYRIFGSQNDGFSIVLFWQYSKFKSACVLNGNKNQDCISL